MILKGSVGEIMSNIFFTEEENAFRTELREFIEAEITPHARDIEENNRYPRELIRKMGEAGYLAVFHPPEYGGSGKGLSTEIIVCEELSAVSPAMDMGRMSSVTLFGAPLRRIFKKRIMEYLKVSEEDLEKAEMLKNKNNKDNTKQGGEGNNNR